MSYTLSFFLLWAGCSNGRSEPSGLTDSFSPSTPDIATPDAGDASFWVAPWGSDFSDGSETKPFATLAHARDAVRNILSVRSGNIHVRLYGGMYRLTEPLVLGREDSGHTGFNVVYENVSGQSPVIAGSVPVTGWRLHDASLNMYKAYVGPQRKGLRQLYVNGKRAQRARTSAYPSGFLPSPEKGGIAYRTTSLNPAMWRNPAQWQAPSSIEAVLDTQWKMMRIPVSSVVSEQGGDQGVLVMQQPAWNNANIYHDASTHQPGIWSFWQVEYFENAYAFLDEPNEWYLDESSGWMYYIPTQNVSMAQASVELPVLESLLNIQGTAQAPVHDVTIKGLTFAYATWSRPSTKEGYVSDQSGFCVVGEGHVPNETGHDPDVEPSHGNISVSYAYDIEFRENTFTHLGGAGLFMKEGSQKCVIHDNVFTDISSHGIALGGVGPSSHHPSSPHNGLSEHVVSGNRIEYIGREYHDAAGIMMGFSTHTQIVENTVRHVPWSGIAIGWGWGLLDPEGFPGIPGASFYQWGVYNTPTNNHDNTVAFNTIEYFLEKLWDGGAIYTTGAQGTSMQDALQINNNIAMYKRPQAGGNVFYTDGGTRYVKVSNNLEQHNPVGSIYLGPPPNPLDPLPYSKTPSSLNGIPYGSDIGGCRTYGDMVYENNTWEDPIYYDICPFSYQGISYPVRVTFVHNRFPTAPWSAPF